MLKADSARNRLTGIALVSLCYVLFTLLGFMGLYAMLSVLFLFLAARLIARGPAMEAHS